MTGLNAPETSHERDSDPSPPENEAPLACIVSFNAIDPTGSGGLSGDALALGSVGAHLLPVVTGAYLRDSRETVGRLPVSVTVLPQALTVKSLL